MTESKERGSSKQGKLRNDRKREDFSEKAVNMQANIATVPLGYKETKGTRGKHKGYNEVKGCKKALQPQGRRAPFSSLSFFGLVKFSTKEGVTGREHSTKQSARDTGDGERKGRGGRWTSLSSEVR